MHPGATDIIFPVTHTVVLEKPDPTSAPAPAATRNEPRRDLTWFAFCHIRFPPSAPGCFVSKFPTENYVSLSLAAGRRFGTNMGMTKASKGTSTPYGMHFLTAARHLPFVGL